MQGVRITSHQTLKQSWRCEVRSKIKLHAMNSDAETGAPDNELDLFKHHSQRHLMCTIHRARLFLLVIWAELLSRLISVNK
jgi:hypothetical protein